MRDTFSMAAVIYDEVMKCGLSPCHVMSTDDERSKTVSVEYSNLNFISVAGL